MIQKVNANNYAGLSIRDLVKVVDNEFHSGMKEIFETLYMNLETARKLEPNEEEIEFALVTLKLMEEKLKEHIRKEEQLLYPVLTLAKRKHKLAEEKIDIKKFIDDLMSEHDWMKNQIKQLRSATGEYKCDPSDTPSHKLAYARLNDLEQDFNKMFFVEEKFLFPRALKIRGEG